MVNVIAATDPEASAWVSANAGAGKTHLLTDRVTRLLLSGASPSRILCLTYTKAAAAEMATRLFGRLGDWALLADSELTAKLLDIGAEPPGSETLRRARRLFAQALEIPGGLKIQTIECLTSAELSVAVGRENVIHAALKSGRLQERLSLDAERLARLSSRRHVGKPTRKRRMTDTNDSTKKPSAVKTLTLKKTETSTK
jgi:ATP-dependent helicase/nuclease subunit A